MQSQGLKSQLTETMSSSASRQSTKPWRISILCPGDEVNALISWLWDVGYIVTARRILTADSVWWGNHELYVTYLQIQSYVNTKQEATQTHKIWFQSHKIQSNHLLLRLQSGNENVYATIKMLFCSRVSIM